MSLLIVARGVAALSQIEIDSNKDWSSREISNIAAIAANMTQGDLVYYGTALTRLAAGSSGHNLQCLGPGNNPRWS
jgi:hypothetical protein